jgi:formylglycine-generating enzyme required for sulfatase activity
MIRKALLRGYLLGWFGVVCNAVGATGCEATTFTIHVKQVSVNVAQFVGGSYNLGYDPKDFTGSRKHSSPTRTVHVEEFVIASHPLTIQQVRNLLPIASLSTGAQDWIREGPECPECPMGGLNLSDVTMILDSLNTESVWKAKIPTEDEWEVAASCCGQVLQPWAGLSRSEHNSLYGINNTSRPVGSIVPGIRLFCGITDAYFSVSQYVKISSNGKSDGAIAVKGHLRMIGNSVFGRGSDLARSYSRYIIPDGDGTERSLYKSGLRIVFTKK